MNMWHELIGLSAAEELNKKNGWDMRIHVDAASGGFIAPFIFPDLEFDFRLKNVNSVSASGHKYERSRFVVLLMFVCASPLFFTMLGYRDDDPRAYHPSVPQLSSA